MSLTSDDLKSTFDAFNRHDIEGVMTHFAEDCVFDTIGGAEAYGTRIKGRDAIAEAFTSVWTGIKDAQWADHRHFISGDRGVSEWTFRGTNPDGTRIDAEGVDLFTIRDGKIVEKRAFRKQRPALPAA